MAHLGPVTDYSSSLVQWMRVRHPKYKGGHRLEWERPSASYAIDVSSLFEEPWEFRLQC